ncbi:MAG: tetratricopeptide repeat protein, partial [Candidatus Omnitrophica bacterium]|nr:tetratricopeptide repeat protein [Candidatus Omnitrophota bacterium]
MKKTALKKKILLIFTGILFSLFLLEIGMRLSGAILLSRQERFNKFSSDKDAYTIMCLGESTTARGGKYSYPAQLEEILNEKNLGIKFNVINKGKEGIESSSVLNCLKDNLEKYEPDMVIIMMGVNDDCGTMAYEDSFDFRVRLFFKKLRVYKLIKTISRNLKEKLRRESFYKPYRDFATLFRQNTNYSNFSALFKGRAGSRRFDVGIIIKSAQNYGLMVFFLNLPQVYAQEVSQQTGDCSSAILREENISKGNFRKQEVNRSNIADFIKLGYEYFKEKDFGSAEMVFKSVLESFPSERLALQGLGRVYVKQGLLKEAEIIFKKLLKKYPDWKAVYKDLGYVYNQLEELEAAEKIFKKLVQMEPDNIQAYRNLGYSYDKRGLLPEARRVYSKVLELSREKDIKDYLSLGSIYFKQEDYVNSEKIYSEALDKYPDNQGALEGLGFSCLRQGELEIARKIFEKVLSIYPDSEEAYTGLAVYYDKNNNPSQAEKMFKQAISLNPRYSLPYHRLASLYVDQNRHQEAAELLQRGIDIMPRTYGLYSDLGGVYTILKDYSRAEKVLKKGLEIESKYEPLYTALGVCYRKQDKPEKIDDLAQRIIDSGIDSDRLYGLVANAFYEQGKIKEAEKYYKKASEYRLNYYNPSTLYNYQKLKEILDEKGIQLV